MTKSTYNVRISDTDPVDLINCCDCGNLLHLLDLTESEFFCVLSIAEKNELYVIVDNVWRQ